VFGRAAGLYMGCGRLGAAEARVSSTAALVSLGCNGGATRAAQEREEDYDGTWRFGRWRFGRWGWAQLGAKRLASKKPRQGGCRFWIGVLAVLPEVYMVVCCADRGHGLAERHACGARCRRGSGRVTVLRLQQQRRRAARSSATTDDACFEAARSSNIRRTRTPLQRTAPQSGAQHVHGNALQRRNDGRCNPQCAQPSPASTHTSCLACSPQRPVLPAYRLKSASRLFHIPPAQNTRDYPQTGLRL
jgi:hypothetical protein